MNGKKKTVPGIVSIEGGAGNRISGQTIGDPATQYNLSWITVQGADFGGG